MWQTWLLVGSCLIHVVASFDLNDSEWKSFKAAYNKTYTSAAEEAARLAAFRDNLRRIAEHNAGDHSFRLGVNQLADLSPAEYRGLMTAGGGRPRWRPGWRRAPRPGPAPLGPRAAAVDWRQEGAVTLVKDVGSCQGASWAFAASGAVESAWKIAGHELTRLSEQQLLDCSESFGNNGCEGGAAANAFEYLLSSAGLHAERDYPYRYETDLQCQSPPYPTTANISDWFTTTRDSERELAYVVAAVGPAAARIDASHTSFQLYSHGVYQDRKCSARLPTLDVLVVGFGEEGGVPFWLVKNAWGPGWGDVGYIKIRRNAGNMCGVATEATYPVV